VFSGVLIAYEVDGVEDKGSGDVQALLEAFLYILRLPVLLMMLFSDKKQNFQSWDCSPVLDYWTLRL
jgi:hypothetical protein